MEKRMTQTTTQLTHITPQRSFLVSNSQEKSHHISYLDSYRVESCPLFLQNQCQKRRPYTCFNWHFANQRRRRSLRQDDGFFNYSPDIYCDKYNENTGICPDGDSCPYLHRVSGDVERNYHLRYYKTARCVHPTDARGQCVKNGAHCAFAHSPEDLREAKYDKSEATYGRCVREEARMDQTSCVNDDLLWSRQDHVLSFYKTEKCKKPTRLCRQGYACPFYHNSKDRRRQPAIFKYRSIHCPAVRIVHWLNPKLCEQGNNCCYCHTRTEKQFHPEIYKSTICKDILEHGYCPRGVFCAFAHDDSEMDVTRIPCIYMRQHLVKEQIPDYGLGSPLALNESNYQSIMKGQPLSNGRAIQSRGFSTSHDDLISSSYPKERRFEKRHLWQNYQADQRNHEYSFNIGQLDMGRRMPSPLPLAREYLSMSDAVAQIIPPSSQTSQDVPLHFHTPFSHHQNRFQQKIPLESRDTTNVFSSFPAAKNPYASSTNGRLINRGLHQTPPNSDSNFNIFGSVWLSLSKN